MSYRDPFAEQHGRYDPHFNEAPAFDPYNSSEPHQAYDQGGYDPDTSGYKDYPTTHQPVDSQPAAYAQKEAGGYDSTAFARTTPRKCVHSLCTSPEINSVRSRSRDLRRWRYEHHGGSLWTKVLYVRNVV